MLATAAMPAVAAAAQGEAAAAPRAITTETVWVKGKGAAELLERVNRMHAEMAAKGFRFASLAPYTENGDVLGLLVTYVRD
jgi:hypothetical protein